jgi:phage host-nuclease inhibitor protein Gam
VDSVLATIRRLHPHGAVFQTLHHKRTPEPCLLPWRGGWKARINGAMHWFDAGGRLLSADARAAPGALRAAGECATPAAGPILAAMSDSESLALVDDDACAAAIAAVAEIDRALLRVEADKNEAVAVAAQRAEDQAGPLIEKRAILVRSVQDYCEQHRARLTDNGKRKFAPFPTGEGVWRQGRDTVDIDPAETEALVAKLKAMGKAFLRFIRVSESLRKTALNDATETEKARLRKLKGLRFVKGEESFAVRPLALPLAERPVEAAADG